MSRETLLLVDSAWHKGGTVAAYRAGQIQDIRTVKPHLQDEIFIGRRPEEPPRSHFLMLTGRLWQERRNRSIRSHTRCYNRFFCSSALIPSFPILLRTPQALNPKPVGNLTVGLWSHQQIGQEGHKPDLETPISKSRSF